MTATLEETALLAAIKACPAEDTHRLVYADVLQAAGRDAEAELIRLMCRMEGEAPCRDCSQWSCRDCGVPGCWFGSRDRAEGLLSRVERPMPVCSFLGRSDVRKPGYYWRKGLIAEAHMTLADWMRHGPEIVRKHPVERVVLTDKVEYWNGKGYTFYRASRPRRSPVTPRNAELPDELWAAGGNLSRMIVSKTREEARQFLSELCLAWAEGKAATIP